MFQDFARHLSLAAFSLWLFWFFNRNCRGKVLTASASILVGIHTKGRGGRSWSYGVITCYRSIQLLLFLIQFTSKSRIPFGQNCSSKVTISVQLKPSAESSEFNTIKQTEEVPHSTWRHVLQVRGHELNDNQKFCTVIYITWTNRSEFISIGMFGDIASVKIWRGINKISWWQFWESVPFLEG